MKTKIILVGGFLEIIELCEECGYDVVGIIDNKLTGIYHGIPILGNDIHAENLFTSYASCKLVITPDSPYIRQKLYNYYNNIGYNFATIISPSAKISPSATIGEGTIIQSGVNVSSLTYIGNFCKLNSCCNIMHDNIIQDYCTIAPNAVLLGRVKIASNVYIGANCTILPNIKIKENAIIGAGAVVTKNIEVGITVKGVPAR